MFVQCPKCEARYQVPEGIVLSDGKKLKCSACEFVFPHAEQEPTLSAPLPNVEEQESTPVVKSPVSSVETSENDAFQSPLYASDEVPDELPEAFLPVPVAPPKRQKGWAWLAIIVFLLCLLGYFRWARPDLFSQISMRQSAVVSRPVVQTASVSTPMPALELRAEPEVLVVVEDVVDEPVSRDVVSVIEEEDADEVLPRLSELEALLGVEDETPAEINLMGLKVREVDFRIETIDAVDTVLIEGVITNESSVDVQLPEKLSVHAYGDSGEILFQKDIFLIDTFLGAQKDIDFYGSYAPAPQGIIRIDAIL